MFIILLLAALALWGIVQTIVEIRRDGYRALATDWSRVADQGALDRAESSVAYR